MIVKFECDGKIKLVELIFKKIERKLIKVSLEMKYVFGF